MRLKLVITLSFLVAAFTIHAQTVFNYTGGFQSYVVPAGTFCVDIVVQGAQGGGINGGAGAQVSAQLPVTPGQTLRIYVGGRPGGMAAGYNGGGVGRNATSAGDPSFGGGGGTDVRVSPYGVANRIIVAGGGGGTGGGTEDALGGIGGCANGGLGAAPFGVGGVGGTQAAGGAGGAPWIASGNWGANGALFQGGAGATDPCYNNSPGGGGGGGYYGGGGGGSDCFDLPPYGGGGGGGGSSLTPAGGVCAAGVRNGNGRAMITNVVCTLPVELLNYWGENQQNENHLHWTTATEINNDYFILEASATGTEPFVELGMIPGGGNSSNPLDYTFVDKNPMAQLTYYRLKQVDFDGKISHIENIVPLRMANYNDFVIYPNPAVSDELTVAFEEEISAGTLTITNSIGQQVKTIAVNNQSHIKFTLNCAAGVYFVQLSSANKTISKKLIKE